MTSRSPIYGCRCLIITLISLLPLLSYSQIPENDDPCPTDSNPPIDLTSVGNHLGTTCEATFDFANLDCGADTEEASVWYIFTPNGADDGYDITLSPVGGADDAEGPITLEIYNGTINQGCTGFSTTLGASCTSSEATIKVPNDFDSGEIIYIKITTASDVSNCGEFNISIVPATCGAFANTCWDITSAQTLNPITLDMFILNYVCASGCIDYATPDLTATGGCEEFADNPTIWYKINVDDNAQQLYTTVNTFGNWDAVWSIYGGEDCSVLEIISSEGQTCSNGDLTPELFQIGVESTYENYYLAVTVDPNSVPITGIDDGTFEVCVSTVVNGIVCLGSLEGDCAESSLVIEVTERELEGESLDGPFCPGEEVSVHVSFTYDASETSSDWLSGIIPKFGPGWNLENFDYNGFAPTGNASTAEWIEETSPCAPAMSENVSHLCTYVDENGKLVLCNSLCESCVDCPFLGMQEEDPLPSGYFWISTGAGADCDNDCSPQEGWGIGAIVVEIEWNFTLRVKDYVDYETCFTNDDLQISLQTFSQGVVGCWEDPIGECLIDKSQFGPLWKVDCFIPPEIIGPDQEICDNSVTDILVETADGSSTTIIVEADDNPNVTGEMDHTFVGGQGTISDNLSNLTNSTQVVTYTIYAEDNTLTCLGIVNTIEVTVYPELDLYLDPTFVCLGQCTSISMELDGGSGGPYMYEWSTGEETQTIEVCPDVPTTYSLTITDQLGCTDVDEVQVNVSPIVELSLPESMEVCKDDNFDPFNPDYMVCLDFLDGSPPYSVTWSPPPGLVGSTSGVIGECFIINEVLTSEFTGPYQLDVSVTDTNGCIGDTDMTINVTGDLTMILSVQDLECDDNEATINMAGFDSSADPLTFYIVHAECLDDGSIGPIVDEIFTSSGSASTTVNLLNYTCYTIVGYANSGCQIVKEISIPQLGGTEIEIIGTDNICIEEEATITITNASDFVSFEWSPDIGSTGSVSITPDSTITYFVQTTDMFGCLSQAVFTVTVNDLDSPFCADPCEDQTSEYQITGIAFSDDNANGVQDIGEQPLSNVQIKDLSNNFTVFTNEFGIYVLPSDVMDVAMEAYISEGVWMNSTLTKTLELDIPCKTDVNFAFQPLPDDPDVTISVANSMTRCDFETKFYITVENVSHNAINGTVAFTFDDETNFFSTAIENYQLINNTVTFETGEIEGFASKTFIIILKMPSGSSVLPQLSFNTELHVEGNLMDTYAYDQQLLCSYDPNDKRTYPDRPGAENLTLREETIEYTIRFQNNGNDTAYHVRIVDVLEPHIIKSSIRFISASHVFEACLSGDSLIMDFENIFLVDSMTNYEASQGYINLSCNFDPTVADGTEIFNTADIIFDTNPPIVTNTTLNTIVDQLCENTSVDVQEEICQGEIFMGYETSGSYQIVLTTELGCDSLINLDLDVIVPSMMIEDPITACGEETIVNILGNNFEIDSTGVYAFEFEGASGCIEQIVSIDVTLIPTEEIFEAFTICEGDILEYEGETYEIDSTGNYEFEILSAEGCVEQLLNFEVNVISVEQNMLDYQICEDVVVTYEDVEYEFDSSGIYSYTLMGTSGCDEIELIFDITVYETVYSEIDTTICEGQNYEGLEETGEYTLESADPITGCPVFKMVNLTVLPLSDPACVTSISESLLQEVEVFPIPANNSLIIKSDIQLNSITLLSTTGKILSKENNIFSKELKMDISQLPIGFHFLVIETDYGRIMKKVIVSR